MTYLPDGWSPGITTEQSRVAVVVPCWNEDLNVASMSAKICEATQALGRKVTVLFVDDGSTDATWLRICEEIDSVPSTQHTWFEVQGIRLCEHAGKAMAQAVGISSCRGVSTIVVMDGDGQHPPSAIQNLVREAETSGLPTVARRTHYSRSPLSAFGVQGLKFLMRIVGNVFDPDLSEFVAIPHSHVQRLCASPQFGIAPLLSLVTTISGQPRELPISIVPRLDGDKQSKWTISELWKKALLHLLADPWHVLPRITLLAVVSFAVLFLAAVGSAVHAVHQGTSPGTVAILASVVILAGLSVAMWVASIAVGVLTFRLVNAQSSPQMSLVSFEHLRATNVETTDE